MLFISSFSLLALPLRSTTTLAHHSRENSWTEQSEICLCRQWHPPTINMSSQSYWLFSMLHPLPLLIQFKDVADLLRWFDLLLLHYSSAKVLILAQKNSVFEACWATFCEGLMLISNRRSKILGLVCFLVLFIMSIAFSRWRVWHWSVIFFVLLQASSELIKSRKSSDPKLDYSNIIVSGNYWKYDNP